MEFLLNVLLAFTWQQFVMICIGSFLIFLAIKKEYEPMLLLPMGFGAILVNLPFSGVLNSVIPGVGQSGGIIEWLYNVGISSSEVFPILLFIGIGAMIDFSPLLTHPSLFFLGLFSQLGILAAILFCLFLGFDVKNAASIGIIGAADGPTAILVSQVLHSDYIGPIAVASYSYIALVPIIQPFVIKLLTTKKERLIKMPLSSKTVSKRVRILFPIVVTILVGVIAPSSLALVGFLMFGNLLSECGVLDSLAQTARTTLTNLITLLLGLSISFSLQASSFVKIDTVLIMLVGLFAFVMDTAFGILTAKCINLFKKNKINPMIGASGISAFPMSARVVQRLAQKEDSSNIILQYALGANVAGQIASVLAGGLTIAIVSKILS